MYCHVLQATLLLDGKRHIYQVKGGKLSGLVIKK